MSKQTIIHKSKNKTGGTQLVVKPGTTKKSEDKNEYYHLDKILAGN